MKNLTIITLVASLFALGLTLHSFEVKNQALTARVDTLTEQLEDMSAELDNVENQLHIDQESVQN